MKASQIVDFHTHVLPGIDDGSKNTSTSVEMIEHMKKQGVDIVVATPHFYGCYEDISQFLERRRVSFENLSTKLSEECPIILLGAEVAFFSGLSELEGLDKLCIENTNVLLIEMPFAPWKGYEYETIASFCFDHHLQVVLAHYERFAQLQKNNNYYERILHLPVKVQINAESLLPLFKRNQWLNMFRNGQAHLLGSDCHDMSNRAPNLAAAREVIRKKFGTAMLDQIDAQSFELLKS